MRIVDIKISPLFCKFKEPYFWAQGVQYGAKLALIEIFTDSGKIGIGETPATVMPLEPIISFLEQTKSILVGGYVWDISRLMREIYTHNFGIETASHSSPRIANQIFAGIELALWDAFGKNLDLPLHKLLGGNIHSKISYFGFVQGNTDLELGKHAEELARADYSVIYLKVGRSDDLDYRNTAAVRKMIGNKRLRLDPNEAWNLLQAEHMINKLSKFELEMVEQPISSLSDLNTFVNLRKNIRVPLAADQSVFTPEEAQKVCATGAVSLITIGLHETGGIIGFKKVAAVAETFNINVCLHGVFETGITTCASLQVASTTPNLDDGNQIMWQLLNEDLVAVPSLEPRSGNLSVCSLPGLGFQLNQDAVALAKEEYKSIQ